MSNRATTHVGFWGNVRTSADQLLRDPQARDSIKGVIRVARAIEAESKEQSAKRASGASEKKSSE